MSDPYHRRPWGERYGSLNLILLVLALFCAVIFTLAAHGTIVTKEGFTWLGASLSLFIASFIF